MLTETIEGIAKDAERRVLAQIETHEMHTRGEPWLSDGLGYIRNNACPFCGQPLDAAIVIAAYQAYFSEAYRTLRAKIMALRQQIDDTLSEREIARIERTLDKNRAALEFWSRYCTIRPPGLARTEPVGDTLRSIRQTAAALLDRKAAAPLEKIVADERFTSAQASFEAAQTDAVDYNQAVQAANAAIAAKKTATGGADIRSVEGALARLQAMKRRHEPTSRLTCENYQIALAEKAELEDRKAAFKGRLDAYTQQVVGRYEQTMNRLLDDFQAGFRISGTAHGYPGGVASSNYQILINDTAVELGDPTTPHEKPSFRNTLSSGDRSTLALSFFLAQLEDDPEKASKIVIFDDPFNSQDNFRKDCTVKRIKLCGESCTQVIVLSHDQFFLKRIWQRLSAQQADRKCLQLARVGIRDTRISTWDIEQATQARFVADRTMLAEYYNTVDGNLRDIVNKIRPVLEAYCKYLLPGEFAAADTLGTIIGKVRAAGAAHQLFALLVDLDALNEYTRRYHHGESENAATEPISDVELQGFVKKTLEITGGL